MTSEGDREEDTGIPEEKPNGDSPAGNCILAVFHGDFTNPDLAKRTLEEAVANEGLMIIGSSSRTVEDGTVMHTLLLRESHAALHVYPSDHAVFEIYSCRGVREGNKTLDFIAGRNANIIDHASFHILVKKPTSQHHEHFEGKGNAWQHDYDSYVREWHNGLDWRERNMGGGRHYFAAAIMHGVAKGFLADKDKIGRKFYAAVQRGTNPTGTEIHEPQELKDALDFWHYSPGDKRYSALAYSNGCFFALHTFPKFRSIFITANSPGKGECARAVIGDFTDNIDYAEILTRQNSLRFLGD